MAIGCLPFLIMLIALATGYFAFGPGGLIIFAVIAFILLQIFPL